MHYRGYISEIRKAELFKCVYKLRNATYKYMYWRDIDLLTCTELNLTIAVHRQI